MRKMKRIKGAALACAIGLSSFSFIGVTSASAAENTNVTSNKAAKGLAVCNAQYENTKVRTEASTSSKIAYNVANGTRFTGEWVKGQTVNGTNQWLKFYDSNWKTHLYVSKSVCN
ncbi:MULTISPECIES: SH3 domain-containing protein [Bacillus cereus group]|uniref:SH3 domain-containing protein n=1 Tax=Bacillus cereus group TaxID=86661 RepID=UPI00103DE5F5|nr:SH3 domain-containing protein [Bacillus thuringiensis]TBX38582.1 SH3 domain-containing protein [Bacillus thuringiensis]